MIIASNTFNESMRITTSSEFIIFPYRLIQKVITGISLIALFEMKVIAQMKSISMRLLPLLQSTNKQSYSRDFTCVVNDDSIEIFPRNFRKV